MTDNTVAMKKKVQKNNHGQQTIANTT